MRILYICGDINVIGGIEKYNRDFITALSKNGANLEVIFRWRGGWRAKFSFLIRVLLAYWRFKPNFFICGHINFAPICFLMYILFGTPYTISYYGIEIPGIKGFVKGLCTRHAHLLITISEFTRSLIEEHMSDTNDKIFMLPSAIDGEIYKITPRSRSLIDRYGLEGKSVILSLARLSTQEFKGQDRVLQALPFVLKEIPDAIYLIVGAGEDARVNSILEQNPTLRTHVILTGAVRESDKVDFYNLADVYVLPSKYDGFLIVFIEALACGLPVIAPDGYGCRPGLMNGELGSLVDPDDCLAIATEIVKVLSGRKAPKLLDRNRLRQDSLDIYGMEMWNIRVNNLVKILSNNY